MKKLMTICLLATASVLSISAQGIYDIEADVTRELNPVLSSIMTRTSIRKYTDQPVSKADIETLLRHRYWPSCRESHTKG